MKILVILKTNKDIISTGPDSDIHALLPDNYPMSCLEVEFDSLEEAQVAHPGKTVMESSAYNSMLDSMIEEHKDIVDLFELKSTDPEKYEELLAVEQAKI